MRHVDPMNEIQKCIPHATKSERSMSDFELLIGQSVGLLTKEAIDVLVASVASETCASIQSEMSRHE